MLYQYQPPTSKPSKVKYHKISKSGPDVLMRELSEKAHRRKLKFEILPKTTCEWVKVEVTEANGKKGIVEIYDTLGAERACNCNDYFAEQGSACIHLAALEGIEKLGWATDAQASAWLTALSKERIKIPFLKHSYGGCIYWDSANQSSKILGKTPQFSENWLAYSKYKQQQTVASSGISTNQQGNLPSSVGLLQNNLNLYQYQEDIFQKMILAKRGICSMVIGSGKTITTIACCEYLKRHKNPNMKVLVIAPKSLCLQWISEFNRAIGAKAEFVKTPEQIKKISNGGIYVGTYQFITRHIDEFKKHNYDCVVIDEIQFIKNNDTKTWKAISKIKSEYFYGLSGTVIENRLDDFYSIMEIVAPNKLGPKWKFCHEFQDVLAITSSKVIYTGVRNLDVLKQKVKDHVWFYDQLVLPPITHIHIPVKCEHKEREIHDEYREKARLLISKSMNTPLSPAEKIMLQAFLLKARQAANAAELISKTVEPTSNKVKEMLNLVQQHISKNEKLVIFSEWTQYLSICKREANALGIKSVVYTGEENLKQRQKAVDDFQKDPQVMIFFASEAAGPGLNGLQLASHTMIHMELPWNPSKLDQRTGRIYRTLQTKPVTVYYLISEETIETTIEKLLDSKRDVRKQTLESFQ